MALFIFNPLKRLSVSLNFVRLQSKCLSHASFVVAGQPKIIPPICIEAEHPRNKVLSQQMDLSHQNAAENMKLNTVLYSQNNPTVGSDGGSSNPNQCSEEQLALVFENLKEYLPKLFVTVMDYSIYHPQLIFENNIQGKRTVGLSPYIYKISIVRMIGHYKYAYVNMEILKMTKHPEDSTIKIRWRISGITGLRLALQMWKFRVWKPSEMLDRRKIWVDGFSTMYVGSDGKIFKHVADKVMPDQNFEEREKSKIISPLHAVPKMALFVGLSSDISSVILT